MKVVLKDGSFQPCGFRAALSFELAAKMGY